MCSVKCLSPSTPETSQASGWEGREGDVCHVWSTASRFSATGVRNAIVQIVSGWLGVEFSHWCIMARISHPQLEFFAPTSDLQSFVSGFPCFSPSVCVELAPLSLYFSFLSVTSSVCLKDTKPDDYTCSWYSQFELNLMKITLEGSTCAAIHPDAYTSVTKRSS